MPAYPNMPFSDSCVSRDTSCDIARESNSYTYMSIKGRGIKRCCHMIAPLGLKICALFQQQPDHVYVYQRLRYQAVLIHNRFSWPQYLPPFPRAALPCLYVHYMRQHKAVLAQYRSSWPQICPLFQ